MALIGTLLAVGVFFFIIQILDAPSSRKQMKKEEADHFDDAMLDRFDN